MCILDIRWHCFRASAENISELRTKYRKYRCEEKAACVMRRKHALFNIVLCLPGSATEMIQIQVHVYSL